MNRLSFRVLEKSANDLRSSRPASIRKTHCDGGIDVSGARVMNAVDTMAKSRNVKKDIALTRIAQAVNTRCTDTAGLFSNACQHPSINPAIGPSHTARLKVDLCDVVPIADSPCTLPCPCVDGADIRDVPSCAITQPWRLLNCLFSFAASAVPVGCQLGFGLPDF